jgi:hypothetical protein
MLKSSSISPVIFTQWDLKDLGDELKRTTSRTLLISSTLREERLSLEVIKDLLTEYKVTFIECSFPVHEIALDVLNATIERARNFNVTSVISIGRTSQRMAGRYISNILYLPYYECISTYYNPLLLNSEIIFPNRVGNGYLSYILDRNLYKGVTIIERSVESFSLTEKKLHLINLLFDVSLLLAQNHSDFLYREGENLFNRIISAWEKSFFNTKELFQLGLCSSILQSYLNLEDFEGAIIPWILGHRFKTNSFIIRARLLPWLLEEINRDDLSMTVREIMGNDGAVGRLSELGITANQLLSIEVSERNRRILEKAF